MGVLVYVPGDTTDPPCLQDAHSLARASLGKCDLQGGSVHAVAEPRRLLPPGGPGLTREDAAGRVEEARRERFGSSIPGGQCCSLGGPMMGRVRRSLSRQSCIFYTARIRVSCVPRSGVLQRNQ